MTACYRLLILALLVAPAVQAQVSGDPAEESEYPDAAGEAMGPKPGPGELPPGLSNPLTGEPSAAAEGRRLFLWMNCYGCHGGRAGGGMGPSLRDAAWLYGNSDADVFNSISEGRPHGMPAWGTMLPDQEIWRLTAYIKSLDTDEEPDAPPANPVFPEPPPRRDVKGVKAGGGEEE